MHGSDDRPEPLQRGRAIEEIERVVKRADSAYLVQLRSGTFLDKSCNLPSSLAQWVSAVL